MARGQLTTGGRFEGHDPLPAYMFTRGPREVFGVVFDPIVSVHKTGTVLFTNMALGLFTQTGTGGPAPPAGR